jgi:NAD(P)-dependent dehydrogenase (short-subunit alcohol dehydrogenase family)
MKPAEMFDLTGKVAVVTGGSRGIGKAIVHGFAEAGADVVIASRKLASCEAVAEEIRGLTGREAYPVSVNVSDWDDCGRLADAVYDRFGHCEVLVNNAGLSPLFPDLGAVSEELYDKTHAVNARGPFRLSVSIGERMAKGNGGSIINVSTGGSLRPMDIYLPYAMAKAGLNALTLGLAGAWAPRVRANTLIPGPYDTDITLAWPEGQKERAADDNPMQRIGRPEDMVGAAVWLASDAASFVNGAQILVDGGQHRSL